MADTVTTERRVGGRPDRRRHSRSGRRASDPHESWRRATWLFAGYVLYWSMRSLPTGVKNVIRRARRQRVAD